MTELEQYKQELELVEKNLELLSEKKDDLQKKILNLGAAAFKENKLLSKIRWELGEWAKNYYLEGSGEAVWDLYKKMAPVSYTTGGDVKKSAFDIKGARVCIDVDLSVIKIYLINGNLQNIWDFVKEYELEVDLTNIKEEIEKYERKIATNLEVISKFEG